MRLKVCELFAVILVASGVEILGAPATHNQGLGFNVDLGIASLNDGNPYLFIPNDMHGGDGSYENKDSNEDKDESEAVVPRFGGPHPHFFHHNHIHRLHPQHMGLGIIQVGLPGYNYVRPDVPFNPFCRRCNNQNKQDEDEDDDDDNSQRHGSRPGHYHHHHHGHHPGHHGHSWQNSRPGWPHQHHHGHHNCNHGDDSGEEVTSTERNQGLIDKVSTTSTTSTTTTTTTTTPKPTTTTSETPDIDIRFGVVPLN